MPGRLAASGVLEQRRNLGRRYAGMAAIWIRSRLRHAAHRTLPNHWNLTLYSVSRPPGGTMLQLDQSRHSHPAAAPKRKNGLVGGRRRLTIQLAADQLLRCPRR